MQAAANNDDLWDAARLGQFLGLSASTVVTLSSRSPERLPPRVAAMHSPRWMPEIVRSWAMKSSGVGRRKGGRPRN